jgi:hypothetical protein
VKLRILGLATTMALVLGPASAAFAQPAVGTIDLSWDDCSPIVSAKDSPAAGPVTFFASVIGNSDAHKAHQVWWVVGDAQFSLPDAWRFDAAGCNAGFYFYSSQPPVPLAKSCPPFVPRVQQQFTIPLFQLAPPSLPWVPTMGTGFFAVSYPSGVTALDPQKRYLLASFTHDFTWAVEGAGTPDQTCGGFEVPVCIQLVRERVTYLDANGEERLFNIGNATLTFRGTKTCFTTPAHAATWGSIKNQYR